MTGGGINLTPRFSAEDAERAHDMWGANCGPGAIAAICGLTLDELRPFMGDFERKGHTTPTLMWEVLRTLGVSFKVSVNPKTWPRYGLARVQWEGPWTEPGVPIRARYRHTHWVGSQIAIHDIAGVFDINAMANGTGWCALADWEGAIVPWIIKECVPRGNGRWHLTHAVEVDPSTLPKLPLRLKTPPPAPPHKGEGERAQREAQGRLL